MEHVKLKRVSLKNHPTLTERWVQDVISNDPKILLIGDVRIIDRERIQPRAGRLDILLQDEDGHGRHGSGQYRGASGLVGGHASHRRLGPNEFLAVTNRNTSGFRREL